MSNSADRTHEMPHGAALLPDDLTDDQLAAAPILTPTESRRRRSTQRVRVVVDTGVFSASISRGARGDMDPAVR